MPASTALNSTASLSPAALLGEAQRILDVKERPAQRVPRGRQEAEQPHLLVFQRQQRHRQVGDSAVAAAATGGRVGGGRRARQAERLETAVGASRMLVCELSTKGADADKGDDNVHMGAVSRREPQQSKLVAQHNARAHLSWQPSASSAYRTYRSTCSRRSGGVPGSPNRTSAGSRRRGSSDAPNCGPAAAGGAAAQCSRCCRRLRRAERTHARTHAQRSMPRATRRTRSTPPAWHRRHISWPRQPAPAHLHQQVDRLSRRRRQQLWRKLVHQLRADAGLAQHTQRAAAGRGCGRARGLGRARGTACV